MLFRLIRRLGKSGLVALNLIAVVGLLLAYLATHVSPETVPFLPLFGIGYGISLFANLLFIVFWLLVKKRLALISAVAILIGFNHLSAYLQVLPTGAQAPDGGATLQVVSQNVKLFGWYNWRSNKQDRDQMIANLASMEGDIYCFQEYFHHSEPEVFDTRNRLRESLETPSVHVEYTGSIGGTQHYGIATFTKYPIVAKGKIEFEGERSNTCIYTDLKIAGDTVRVYNAHVASIRFSDADYRFLKDLQEQRGGEKILSDSGRNILVRLTRAYQKRAQQTREIHDHIASSPHPVILCGDFNDTPVSYSYAQVSAGLIDAFRVDGWGIGNTYIGTFPSFRIDYIFYSPVFGSYDYRTYPEEISDHHAIGCKIFVRE